MSFYWFFFLVYKEKWLNTIKKNGFIVCLESCLHQSACNFCDIADSCNRPTLPCPKDSCPWSLKKETIEKNTKKLRFTRFVGGFFSVRSQEFLGFLHGFNRFLFEFVLFGFLLGLFAISKKKMKKRLPFREKPLFSLWFRVLPRTLLLVVCSCLWCFPSQNIY